MKLKFLWWGLAGGAALTIVTGALGYFGGIGYRIAQLLALPAIGSSYVAYHFGILSMVNGLLADPGATFCFASRERRLASHLRAGFPPLAVFVGASAFCVAKLKRSS